MQQLTHLLNTGAMEGINFILSLTAIVTFIYMYNREQKKKVNADDLKELKGYVDQQDKSLHHRVDGIEKRLEAGISDLHKDVKDILKILSKGK